MKSRQIIRELEQGKQQGKKFIKWWRKENDFADFELIDRYIQTTDQFEIENFELLDMDEMWELLKNWQPSRLNYVKLTKDGKIEWQHTDKQGQKNIYTCPYNAHTIMSIFDTVTQGDTIE